MLINQEKEKFKQMVSKLNPQGADIESDHRNSFEDEETVVISKQSPIPQEIYSITKEKSLIFYNATE